ncbi:MAG TPA: hypothetical protein VL326_27375 [Kofleriaceae bacterium]|nr:hypothetical protein [Kofleriaceae bacterium]
MMRRLAFLLLATACTTEAGDDMGMGPGSADPLPELPIRNYVVDHISVPTDSNQARDFGMDVDGDGDVDNKLGNVIATLATMNIDANAMVNRAIDRGDTILLAQIGTTSFYQADVATLATFAGSDPSIAPCASDADTTCRKHLDGTASFNVLTDPIGSALRGSFAGNTFAGSQGKLVVRIALLGSEPIDLVMMASRATLAMTDATKIADGTIAGAVSKEDIDAKVIPAVHANVSATAAAQCTAPTSPPACGCPSGSDGKQALMIFDKSPVDCSISLQEVQDSSLVQALLAPDVEINGVRALSLGVKITAVPASFTAP